MNNRPFCFHTGMRGKRIESKEETDTRLKELHCENLFMLTSFLMHASAAKVNKET